MSDTKPSRGEESTGQALETVVGAQEAAPTHESNAPPAGSPVKGHPNLRPWKPGQSGNPNGRPKIEPRVRRHARKYDMAMCKVLADIAQDPKAPWAERRRAAMDLIAVGSGRPATVQEIAGRDGQPVGPLVQLTFGGQGPGALSAAEAYRLMVAGSLDADPQHQAFRTIEAAPETPTDAIEETPQ
jgi:hypothetical protein